MALSIIREQDNYVAQWGDPDNRHPLPAGIGKVAPEFDSPLPGAHGLHPLCRMAMSTRRRSASPTAFPSRAQPRCTKCGWRTATAWWGWDAIWTRKAAAARKCTW